MYRIVSLVVQETSKMVENAVNRASAIVLPAFTFIPKQQQMPCIADQNPPDNTLPTQYNIVVSSTKLLG